MASLIETREDTLIRVSRRAARSVALERKMLLREAVLLSFCDRVPWQLVRLIELSDKQTRELLFWLDTSGLALYFLDRMTELGMCHILPQAMVDRLQKNLRDNSAKIQTMVRESTEIYDSFEAAGLSYAMLKGFSLWPFSVPKLELRSQLDLDFLITEDSAPKAREILEARGFELHAISGRSWEFKTRSDGKQTLADLYRTTPQKTIELHLEARGLGETSLLTRTARLSIHRASMPILAPVDLFLGQGLHLYKHVVSEGFRTAHAIEFRRHIVARYHDDVFWDELRQVAEKNPQTPAALGLVILLITQAMGEFAPLALKSWTVERMTAPARLWVELYGRRAILAGFPGTKLYLLLQRELEQTGIPVKRSLREILLPYKLPPAIAPKPLEEDARMYVRRNWRQLGFVLFRVRFHLLEGARYLLESVLWRQELRRIDGSKVHTAGASAEATLL